MAYRAYPPAMAEQSSKFGVWQGGKELFPEVRVRRHPKGGGVYVFIPEALLALTKVSRDEKTILVRRYGTKGGEIILRFRSADVRDWDIENENVTPPRKKAETPPPSFPMEPGQAKA